MELLKQRILRDGKCLEGGILKVDSFINHQIDPVLMEEIAGEFARRFSIDFDETFSDSVSQLDSNLYRDDPERFCLTEDGFMLLDSIIFSLYCAY